MTLKRKVRNFFKKVVINIIRNREARAAQEVAQFLIRENRDFRNMSEASLTKAIMSKKQIKLGEVNAL